MRIAIDASSVPPQPAGAGVYAIELTRAMAARDRHDGYALFARGAWAREIIEGKPNWRLERVGATSRAARLAWEQAQLPRALARLGIDVLHSTHHSLPIRPMHARRVVTIHDLTFMRIPGRYPPARRIYMQATTRAAAKVADAIIVPSRTVRADVIRYLRVPEQRIHVVYEAAASRFQPVEAAAAAAVARRYGVDGPYVLSVGSLELGKNRARLFRAMRRLRDSGIDVPLLVVGQRAWKYAAELALVEELGMTGRIIFPGYVADADLPSLYSGAKACAFPSLYEGFGLPVLEAMACGTPVLTSNISATAEVAADAAILVDPASIDQIADGLRRLLTDEDFRADRRERGLTRAAEFSWRRAADETHAVYAHVFARARRS